MEKLVRGLCAGALLGWCIGAIAQDKWGSHIDFEAKPGSKRSLGEADLFIPLMQQERWLLFGNLRGRFDDDSNREGNFGAGLRRMLDGGWNAGGYGYFDRRKSGESSEYYSQLTFGGELLGRDWDFRANAYLPQGERVRQLGAGGGVSTAAISGASVIVTTSATGVTEERALRGFDAEVGWRVPLWEAEGPRQLRLYAGGYRFEDDVTRVSGPRVRAELTLAELPWLWHGAQFVGNAEVQDDRSRGTQAFLALRLRVPLGGKAERPRLNFQERRMTAPVVRDVDIVTQSRTVASAPALVETATALDDGRTFTVLDSATTLPAALPGAVAAAGAGSVVILSGTFNTTATVNLQPGQTLAGSIAVRTPSGRTAMTPGATVAATGTTTTIEMANNSTLSGMTVTNDISAGGGRAVRVNAGGGVTIVNNTIRASSSANEAFGVEVAATATTVAVLNNRITTSSPAHDSLAFVVSTGTALVTVAGNTLNATGLNAFAVVVVGGMVNTAASTGNVREAGSCIIGVGVVGTIGFTDGTCP